MVRDDYKILFTALAFLAVVLKDGDNLGKGSAAKIIKLADVLRSFCAENVPSAFSQDGFCLVEDFDAPRIDAILARHTEELIRNHETRLPEDRESLLQLYDRLQLRKTRRMQWQFYAKATEEKLADLVLRLLDEEIEDLNEGGRQ